METKFEITNLTNEGGRFKNDAILWFKSNQGWEKFGLSWQDETGRHWCWVYREERYVKFHTQKELVCYVELSADFGDEDNI